jgi:hypothetical protein
LVVGPAQVTPVDGIPAALPDIALLDDDGSFDGWVLGVAWAAETFLFILDRDADVVWYERLSLGRATLSVEPVPGEAAVRYLDVSLDHDLDESRVVTLGLDGEELERVDVEQGHHSFEVLPDGTLAWLAIDVRDDPTWGPLVGDRVLARGADGSVRTLWSTWDDFVYDPEVTFETDFYPQGTDWTHGNTLAWDAAQDSFWVTLGGIDQLVEVDAQSGALLTRVGAGGCEITPALDGYGAGYGPHGANSTPEGTLLVFDNHHVAGASASRVVELKLDEDAARVDWVFEGESGWSTLVLGGAKRQADGGTFVAWGDTGYMQLLDAAGRQVWLANVNAIVSDAVLLADPYGR